MTDTDIERWKNIVHPMDTIYFGDDSCSIYFYEYFEIDITNITNRIIKVRTSKIMGRLEKDPDSKGMDTKRYIKSYTYREYKDNNSENIRYIKEIEFEVHESAQVYSCIQGKDNEEVIVVEMKPGILTKSAQKK